RRTQPSSRLSTRTRATGAEALLSKASQSPSQKSNCRYSGAEQACDLTGCWARTMFADRPLCLAHAAEKDAIANHEKNRVINCPPLPCVAVLKLEPNTEKSRTFSDVVLRKNRRHRNDIARHRRHRAVCPMTSDGVDLASCHGDDASIRGVSFSWKAQTRKPRSTFVAGFLH